MNNLLQLGLRFQTIFSGVHLVIYVISWAVVVDFLRDYHDKDRLTFNCIPKPSDFTRQRCYDNYISTLSPLLTPLDFAGLTFGASGFFWILFILKGALLRRRIKKEQNDQKKRRQSRMFRLVFVCHFCFQFLLLSVIMGLFCSCQSLRFPAEFNCYRSNTTLSPPNQGAVNMTCNDLRYKEKSKLNFAIIGIMAISILCCILTVIHLAALKREAFIEQLLGEMSAQEDGSATGINSIGSAKCILSCATTEGDTTTFGNVIDGTPCSDKPNSGVCVNGQCKTVRCDGTIDSRAKVDRCGVCNGDGSSCSGSGNQGNKPRPGNKPKPNKPVPAPSGQLKKFTYDQVPGDDYYQTIATLPVGARDITIQEATASENSLKEDSNEDEDEDDEEDYPEQEDEGTDAEEDSNEGEDEDDQEDYPGQDAAIEDKDIADADFVPQRYDDEDVKRRLLDEFQNSQSQMHDERLTEVAEKSPRKGQRKSGEPDMRFSINRRRLGQQNKDGSPDMRFKVNKEAKSKSQKGGPTSQDVKGPLKKDGTPDRRFKVNKETSRRSSAQKSTKSSLNESVPVKKDGTPDMRYAVNKGATTKTPSPDSASRPVKRDGTPDMRYAVNKTAAASMRSSGGAARPVKRDGTPDMRFAVNKQSPSSQSSQSSSSVAWPSSYAGPVKKDGTPDMRYASNKQSGSPYPSSCHGSTSQLSSYSTSSGPLKRDGTPDMRYSVNKSPAGSPFSSGYSSGGSTSYSGGSVFGSGSYGPLKSDGTPDMRYASNRSAYGSSSLYGGSRYSSSLSSSGSSYGGSSCSGPLKSDGTPDMRYAANRRK